MAALDQTELCAHSTAHDRFQAWVEAGVFLQLWHGGVERFDELCGIDWDWLAMDGAMTKAPLGGGKTGPNPTDRGKSGVKRSLLTEGHGVPIGLAVEGANRHDMKLARATVETLMVARPAPTTSDPQGMCLDAGYDYDEVYAILREFGFTAHVRPRGEEAKAIKHDSGLQSAALGGGAGAFLDEPLSPSAHSLGQEAGELPGVSAFRLWPDCLSGGWVIRIGG